MGKGNFFGQGDTDVVLQNTDGTAALWLMSGTTIVGGGLVAPNPGPTWHIQVTAGGTAITPGSGLVTDAVGNVFTISAAGGVVENGSPIPEGMGTAKLVYYNGQVYGEDAATGSWFILDSDQSFSRAVAPGFFGDGSTDIVLQNDDGTAALWDMAGTAIVGGGLVAPNPGPTWHIKDTGDFFGPGNTDIVLQNDDGTVALWNMSGTTIVGGGFVTPNPGPTWHIEGTGHFFGHGNTDDIVLQNDDGTVALWDMAGTTIVGGGLVAPNPGPTWHVKGTGDFFGHGTTDDIVLQNNDGTVALWDMAGTTIVGGGLVTNPGNVWNVLDNNLQFIYSASANETLAATPATPDEFVFTSFAAGLHTIGGFNPVQDMIEFSKAQFASVTDVQAVTSAISGGAMINLGNGSSLLLPGVDARSLHASNFVLA